MYFGKPELREGSRICLVDQSKSKPTFSDATVTEIDGLNFTAKSDDGKTYVDMMCSGAYLFGGCWYYNINRD